MSGEQVFVTTRENRRGRSLVSCLLLHKYFQNRNMFSLIFTRIFPTTLSLFQRVESNIFSEL